MRLISLALTLCALALAGCGAPATETTSYIPPDTAGGRMCISQCDSIKNLCHEDCTMQERECTTKLQGQALMDYEQYIGDQFMHPTAIQQLRLRDFEHLEPCERRFDSCQRDCESPYKGCYKKCGGTAETTTSCQFMCF